MRTGAPAGPSGPSGWPSCWTPPPTSGRPTPGSTALGRLPEGALMLPSHRIDGPAGAPVLLLGSSLGTTADMWAPQVPTLAQRFRVVRYEHPGHGEPNAPIPPTPITIADLGTGVVELLDHLDVERASLAGVSLGGMVSMWVAAHSPERGRPPGPRLHRRPPPAGVRVVRAGRARAPRGHRPVAARRCWRAGSPKASREPGPTSSTPSPRCWPPPTAWATQRAARRSR